MRGSRRNAANAARAAMMQHTEILMFKEKKRSRKSITTHVDDEAMMMHADSSSATRSSSQSKENYQSHHLPVVEEVDVTNLIGTRIKSFHHRCCHTCSHLAGIKVWCSECPRVYCQNCYSKALENHGTSAFSDGCPFCKNLCCCSADVSSSSICTLKHHCRLKCRLKLTHQTCCHSCGKSNLITFQCSKCPKVYCSRCLPNIQEHYGKSALVGGCPFCKEICCCAAPNDSTNPPCTQSIHCKPCKLRRERKNANTKVIGIPPPKHHRSCHSCGRVCTIKVRCSECPRVYCHKCYDKALINYGTSVFSDGNCPYCKGLCCCGELDMRQPCKRSVHCKPCRKRRGFDKNIIHQSNCHVCGSGRKCEHKCNSCPKRYCNRCYEKMQENHGTYVFMDGCPHCKDLCCCAADRPFNCKLLHHCKSCTSSKKRKRTDIIIKSEPKRQRIKTDDNHQKVCHGCPRRNRSLADDKNFVKCTTCRSIYCTSCQAQFMKAFGSDIFEHGCPECLELCCCSEDGDGQLPCDNAIHCRLCESCENYVIEENVKPILRQPSTKVAHRITCHTCFNRTNRDLFVDYTKCTECPYVYCSACVPKLIKSFGTDAFSNGCPKCLERCCCSHGSGGSELLNGKSTCDFEIHCRVCRSLSSQKPEGSLVKKPPPPPVKRKKSKKKKKKHSGGVFGQNGESLFMEKKTGDLLYQAFKHLWNPAEIWNYVSFKKPLENTMISSGLVSKGMTSSLKSINDYLSSDLQQILVQKESSPVIVRKSSVKHFVESVYTSLASSRKAFVADLIKSSRRQTSTYLEAVRSCQPHAVAHAETNAIVSTKYPRIAYVAPAKGLGLGFTMLHGSKKDFIERPVYRIRDPGILPISKSYTSLTSNYVDNDNLTTFVSPCDKKGNRPSSSDKQSESIIIDTNNIIPGSSKILDSGLKDLVLQLVGKKFEESTVAFDVLKEDYDFTSPQKDYRSWRKAEKKKRKILKIVRGFKELIYSDGPMRSTSCDKTLRQRLEGCSEKEVGDIRSRLRLLLASSGWIKQSVLTEENVLPESSDDLPNTVAFSNYLYYPNNDGLRSGSSYDNVVEAYQTTFCRRCYTYDCQAHGTYQNLPRRRTDPIRVPNRRAAAGRQKPTSSPLVDWNSLVSSSAPPLEIPSTLNDLEFSVSEGAVVKVVDHIVSRAVHLATDVVTVRNLVKKEMEKSAPRSFRRSTNRSSLATQNLSEQRNTSTTTNRGNGTKKSQKITKSSPCSSTCYLQLGNSTGKIEWLEWELVVITKSVSMFNAHACPVMTLLGRETGTHIDGRNITCLDVHNVMASTKPTSQEPTSSESSAITNSEKEILRRTLNATDAMNKEDRMEFIPCNHEGSCLSANCSCVEAKQYCEKSCSCSRDCCLRFTGCRCKSECRTRQCPCYCAERECDPDLCFNCGAHEVRDHFYDSNHMAGLSMCSNLNVQLRRNARIGIARSATHGWGVFAMRNISRGAFVYEYLGDLISQDESERRGKKYDMLRLTYLFDLNAETVVDAMHKGNKIKYCNHHGEKSNCEAKIYRNAGGDDHICLFATRDILAGEELTFDYKMVGENAESHAA